MPTVWAAAGAGFACSTWGHSKISAHWGSAWLETGMGVDACNHSCKGSHPGGTGDVDTDASSSSPGWLATSEAWLPRAVYAAALPSREKVARSLPVACGYSVVRSIRHLHRTMDSST